MELEIKRCPAKQHDFTGQPHKTRDVSIVLFRKNPENPDSPLFKNCLDCRLYSQVIVNRHNNKCNDLHEESKKKNDGYLYCTFKSHENLSTIPRDKVPAEMFRKIPDNPKSSLVKSCSDCRKTKSTRAKVRIQSKKTEASNNEKFYCTACHHTYDLSQRAFNLDGTSSILCIECKDKEKERSVSIRNYYKLVKTEHIMAMNVSCCKCKFIYLCNLEDERTIITLQTFQTEEGIMVMIDGKTFLAKDFITQNIDLLEIDILHLDHLPEDEQRARGLLLPNEIYVPKVRNVSKMSSESAIRLEAAKCQLLCARCHVIETVSRETGLDVTERSHIERIKLNFINDFKSKGCEICLYVNKDLLRFFHCNHINPRDKFENISRMVKDKKYSLDDVKEELKKCQVLCIHCHIIHTKSQRRNGDFNSYETFV